MQKIALLESEKHGGRIGAGSAASVALHAVVLAFAIAVTSHAGRDLTRDKSIFVRLPRWQPPANIVKPAAVSAPRKPTAAAARVPVPAPAIPSVIPPSIAGATVPSMSPSNVGQPSTAVAGSGVGFDSATDVPDGNTALEDYQVDFPAATLAGQRGPVYPEQLRAMGVNGKVVARFVVEKNGRVESEVTILSSTADAFTGAVKRYLSIARYRPAVYKGKPVRQLAEQEFTFTVRN